MRAEVLGQLQYLWWVEHGLELCELVVLLFKDGLEIVESEANAFGNSLSCISSEEDVLLSHGHEQ